MISAFLFFMVLTGLQAQEAISASGGNASGSNGTLSYTVGQVVYLDITGPDGTVTQGVQQPWEIFTVTGIHDAPGISLECLVYPNPAEDFLILRIAELKGEHLNWKLYDASGKMHGIEKITGIKTTIPVSKLTPGVYFLSILNLDEKQLKTFRIIKN